MICFRSSYSFFQLYATGFKVLLHLIFFSIFYLGCALLNINLYFLFRPFYFIGFTFIILLHTDQWLSYPQCFNAERGLVSNNFFFSFLFTFHLLLSLKSNFKFFLICFHIESLRQTQAHPINLTKRLGLSVCVSPVICLSWFYIFHVVMRLKMDVLVRVRRVAVMAI